MENYRAFLANLFKRLPVRIAVGVFLYLTLEALLYPRYFQAPVLVNGRRVVLARPMTLGEAVKRQGLAAPHGDLLDVDGRVLRRGAGRRARILLNGRPAASRTVVEYNDSIIIERGGDVAEPIKRRVEVVPPPVRIAGQGIFVQVSDNGRPGRREVVVGTLSGKLVRSRMLRTPRLRRMVRTDARPEKWLALTFDDGPDPPYTQQIMATLKSLQVPATFFIVGRQAQKHPEVIRELAANGFALANHSFSHGRLDRMPPEAVLAELDQTRALIMAAAGTETAWFRPPYGHNIPVLTQLAAQRGFKLITWDVDPDDWRAPDPAFIVQRVVAAAHPGAVILLHDGGGDRTKTVQALPQIVATLRQQGYTFVTLDQLMP